jgi:hypothetical protein
MPRSLSVLALFLATVALTACAEETASPASPTPTLDFELVEVASVRWYGPEGEFLGEVSSVGQGPGEIQSPATLHVSPDGELVVFDRGTQRVNIFDLGPSGLNFGT